MKIDHSLDKCQFTLFDDEEQELGHIIYRVGEEGELRATHTKVFRPYEGRGYARLLLDAFVDFAKNNNLKIVPVCPYVERSFDKFPDCYGMVRK